jgi:catechol 2,3-dioxygenase-like lactoylglutathione lyase family enzyme
MLLYDHIDLRVSDLAKARPFYEALLSALGFTRKTEIPNWLNYAAAAPESGPAKFFGVTELPCQVANENRIAFWVDGPAEVDRLAVVATRADARNVEGPGCEDETYYAVFFEDPCGNRLEICHHIQLNCKVQNLKHLRSENILLPSSTLERTP